MFSFIHAADLHLDSPLRGLSRYVGAPEDAIRGACRQALDNLVDLAIETEVDFVILAGDLYDGDWPDYNTGLFFADRMARLDRAGIPVLAVSGNHDAKSKITKALKLPDNTVFFPTDQPGTQILDSVGVAIHGQGYAHPAQMENLSRYYPDPVPGYFNIGILHTSLDGREGHAPYAPCSVDDLRTAGYAYWALGHVHGYEVVSEDPWIVFPGNIQGRHIRETGPKGCVLVRVSEGKVALERQDLDVFRWLLLAIDLGEAESWDSALDLIRGELVQAKNELAQMPAAVRIVVTGTTPLHGDLKAKTRAFEVACRAMANEVGDNQLWVERVKIETRNRMDLDQALARDDALGYLVRAIQDLDQGEMTALQARYTKLKSKLPIELYGPDSLDQFDPTQPDELAAALEDVRDILLARLLTGDGP